MNDILSNANSITEIEEIARKALNEVERLKEQLEWYRERVVWGFYEEEKPIFYQGSSGEHEICEPVTSEMVTNLVKSLDIYERERNRYKHSNPEVFKCYFLAGGVGDKDENGLPEFVEIVPEYGVGWSQLYQKIDKQITYEGS
jgi:hypothetical protein